MNAVVVTYRDSDYPNYDRIEVPLLFSLTDDGKREYDVEEMQDILNSQIKSIIEHDERHYQ